MNDLKVLAAQKAAAAQLQNSDFQDLPEDSPELKTPTAEDIMAMQPPISASNSPSNMMVPGLSKNSISQAATHNGGDGGSSTSESSLGSSSGYGSQNTVRPEDMNHSHHPTLTAVQDGTYFNLSGYVKKTFERYLI